MHEITVKMGHGERVNIFLSIRGSESSERINVCIINEICLYDSNPYHLDHEGASLPF